MQGITLLGIDENTPVDEFPLVGIDWNEPAPELTQRLRDIERKIDENDRASFLYRGALWYGRRLRKLHKEAGLTWKQYCEEESTMSYSTINNLIRVWKSCNEVSDILHEIKPTKLYDSLEILEQLEYDDKVEYIEEIRRIKDKEVKEYVKKKLGRANTLDCEHKETIVITMERCVDCKKTVKYEEG